MSSYYRYGNFDGINGATASEMAQSRIDAQTDSIRRPGVKIDVMSDEEWNRRLQASEERRRKKEAQIQLEMEQQHATAKEAAIKILAPYMATVNGQREYQAKLAKKLKAYHEKPAGDKTSAQEWREAYAEVGRLLAGVLVAFHFQLDKHNGNNVQGPGWGKFSDVGLEPDMPQNAALGAYLAHRRVPVSDDEVKYLESLIERKVDLPIFIIAASEDNLKRISQTEGSSLSAPKALLEFLIQDDLMREEITELFLEDDTE
ncbi:hypothetical protein FPSE_09594 [Fusarium pseudograminearum CS3096]|uniref:Uncharacterized protein n=1 Tax=Fusarium pseudograminearum (strain CS3096) TaxID=1028729 RepID=K3VY87_FUSPC|nr:hypothetical protein FPSE_09594 [Fusarium pseudograminearum CS3096]EKJ70220.1 hypothetical protein FPSE_09594 [Fusarium pseudograminearum CS3096]